MRTALVLTTMLAIVGCNNNQSSDEESMRIALDEHLKNEQHLCLNIPSLPGGKLLEGSWVSSKESREILALYQVGLLSRAQHRNPDNTSTTRYKLSESATPYLRKIVRKTFGLNGTTSKTEDKICYGIKRLSAIRDIQPANLNKKTTKALISYTYEIKDLADWTRDRSILEAFPETRKTIEGINKKEERKILQRNNRGWTVIDN